MWPPERFPSNAQAARLVPAGGEARSASPVFLIRPSDHLHRLKEIALDVPEFHHPRAKFQQVPITDALMIGEEDIDPMCTGCRHGRFLLAAEEPPEEADAAGGNIARIGGHTAHSATARHHGSPKCNGALGRLGGC